MGRAARAAVGRGGRGVRDVQQQPRRLRAAKRPDPPPPARRGRRAGGGRPPARGPDAARPRRVNVLAVLHGTDAPAGTFGDVLAERGHVLETWSAAPGTSTPRPVEEYGCVFVFGGAMHPDEEDLHPWLREEDVLIRSLLERGTPLLGVCLGSQLIAKAAGAPVYRVGEPEVGWCAVELTAAADDDPLLGRLPGRFDAFQWHFYGHDVPAGGSLLASSAVCTQAFRLGEAAWGVQFHPEVTLEIVADWVADAPEELPGPADEFLSVTAARIDGWKSLGRSLCDGFLDSPSEPRQASSAPSAARRGATIRATTRGSCARRSRRRAARASRGRSASPSGSSRPCSSPPAGRRAREPRPRASAAPARRGASTSRRGVPPGCDPAADRTDTRPCLGTPRRAACRRGRSRRSPSLASTSSRVGTASRRG